MSLLQQFDAFCCHSAQHCKTCLYQIQWEKLRRSYLILLPSSNCTYISWLGNNSCYTIQFLDLVWSRLYRILVPISPLFWSTVQRLSTNVWRWNFIDQKHMISSLHTEYLIESRIWYEKVEVLVNNHRITSSTSYLLHLSVPSETQSSKVGPVSYQCFFGDPVCCCPGL